MKGVITMLSMIKLSKKVTCFLLVMIFVLTSFSTTALASISTKTVTEERTYTFRIDAKEAMNFLASPRSHIPSTVSYNREGYKGTLDIQTHYCQVSYVGGNIIQVKIVGSYSGTVTAYDDRVITKNINQTASYTYIVPISQLYLVQAGLGGYVPPSIKYDDGQYSGTLKLSGYSCIPVEYIMNAWVRVNIFTVYSGTVTLK